MSNLNTAIVSVAIGGFLAGCAGAATPMPPATQRDAATHARSDAGRSWMDPAAKNGSLLYVSSVLTNDVYVFSYPAGKMVGTLTGFSTPYGLCVDKSANVWVVNDGTSQIIEYAHGGTSPIATLSDPGEYPEGCAVDPNTGDLGVTNFYSTSGSGSVSVYAGAQGPPQIYSDPNLANVRFCGYDAKGNLFVDGVNASSAFVLAELPKGASTLEDIAFKQSVEWPGGVQWDGKHVAVGDTDAVKIYQTTAKGKVTGTTSLAGANYVNQFFIVKGARRKPSTVVAPSQDGGVVAIYKYPAGGSPISTIAVSEPFGAAVSK